MEPRLYMLHSGRD